MKKLKIGIVGLGYVGLPLALAFSNKYNVIGFDTNDSRIKNLELGIDNTLECSKEEIRKAKNIIFTNDENSLKECNIFIITVPTPIKSNKDPDLSHLKISTKVVSKFLKKGDFVIYESTVFPGATEEFCLPILEKNSGLKLNKDFYLGYSPERINPGDKKRKLKNIKKVVSGSSVQAEKEISRLYDSIIDAGIFLAKSIKVAEAAKIIENTQRDINIALMNDLAILFDKLDIDTYEVLKTARTKWNFLPFEPGLVGGHCIGVDPYYLTYKAKKLNHNVEFILSGRNINDNMGKIISKRFIREIAEKKKNISGLKILILGFTFKENCPDTRNTKVIEIYKYLKSKGAEVKVYDPWASKLSVKKDFGFNLLAKLPKYKFDGVIIAVSHNEFKKMGPQRVLELCKHNGCIMDIKSIFPKNKNFLRI